MAWASSFVVDILVERYEPPPTLHGLMMILAGAAFGSNLIKRGGDDD